jgi:MoaA/NifB/PqqE/SkfB family radical SAM enzyme
MDRFKITKTDKYTIVFDPKTGFELLSGTNGNPDPFILDYPSLMDIGIMGHCDNNCVFCYQGDRYQDNMKLDHFKMIVDQSRDFVNQIALGGRGNPNKHENFKEIVSYCRDNNIIPNYTTSGKDLTDDEVRITKEYCGAVAVSMHEKDYTWRAIDMFSKAGCMTNIHFVLSRTTFWKALALLKGENIYNENLDLNKIHAIIFLLFKKQGKGKDLDWSLDDENLNFFFKIMFASEKQRSFLVGMDSCLVNKMKHLDFKLDALQEMSVDSCEGARMSCYISPDMKFMPCSFCDHDRVGQSILKTPIKEVWDTGKEFEDFRQKLLCDPLTCPYEL